MGKEGLVCCFQLLLAFHDCLQFANDCVRRCPYHLSLAAIGPFSSRLTIAPMPYRRHYGMFDTLRRHVLALSIQWKSPMKLYHLKIVDIHSALPIKSPNGETRLVPDFISSGYYPSRVPC